MTCFFLSRVYAVCALVFLLCACSTPGPPFDSYMLSLGWSPQYCAGSGGSSPECAGPTARGFVLHGLWPESAQGRSPENCLGPAFDASHVSDELRGVMPDDRLVKHEWATHGVCSGLSQTAYFHAALRAFRRVNIPAAFQGPVERAETTPAAVRRQFAEANPDFPAEAFAVKDEGRFLAEVRVCLSTDLTPQGCARPGDTRDTTIVVRAAR